jgi:hypothetical protein
VFRWVAFTCLILAACGAGPASDSPEQEPVRTFYGYECTDDCSGHEAGYQWAEERGITDPDDCSGKSESFIEGCRAYAEGASPDDDEDDPTLDPHI